eukprot:COSAG02_NODE_5851_length_3989_cov_1.620308_4_plen_89_part_00
MKKSQRQSTKLSTIDPTNLDPMPWTAYVNHSTTPSCRIETEHIRPGGFPEIWTLDDPLQPLTELTFDYGKDAELINVGKPTSATTAAT